MTKDTYLDDGLEKELLDLVERISEMADAELVFDRAIDLLEESFIRKNAGDLQRPVEESGRSVIRLKLKTKQGKKEIGESDLNIRSYGKELEVVDGRYANPEVPFPEKDGLLDDEWLMVKISGGSTIYCTYVRGRKRCFER